MPERKKVRIIHKATDTLLAEGVIGWAIFPFEDNYYISHKSLRVKGFRFSGIPGLCPYKFIYFWYHLQLPDGSEERMLAWKYWLPNPVFPFIAFRIAVPAVHHAIIIKEY